MEAARADSLGKVTTSSSTRSAASRSAPASPPVRSPGSSASSRPRSPTDEQLGEAAVAVSGMESCMSAVAHAVSEVADRGGPTEVSSSAEALRRVAVQLEGLLARLQPCV